jgi:hypothetical protein
MKNTIMFDDLRYPIGKFAMPEKVSTEDRTRFIAILRDLPAALKLAVTGLDHHQLATPYREGGWTVAQVVHHLADSHMNSYVRFKLALTEDQPTIKPYDENSWADMPDGKDIDVSPSLYLLEALHIRFVNMLNSLKHDDFQRTFIHPASNRILKLETVLALYAWHSEHHLAHITHLRKRMHW